MTPNMVKMQCKSNSTWLQEVKHFFMTCVKPNWIHVHGHSGQNASVVPYSFTAFGRRFDPEQLAVFIFVIQLSSWELRALLKAPTVAPFHSLDLISWTLSYHCLTVLLLNTPEDKGTKTTGRNTILKHQEPTGSMRSAGRVSEDAAKYQDWETNRRYKGLALTDVLICKEQQH